MSFKKFLTEDVVSDMQRMKETLVAGSSRPVVTAEWFDKLIKAVEDGKIYNVVYKDAMDHINRRFEEAYSKVEDFATSQEWRAYREKNQLPWDYFSPRIINTASTIKQMEKYIKDNKAPVQYFNSRINFLKIFLPFKEVSDLLKKNVIAGRVPNPNAVPKFQPSYSPQDAMKVSSAFKELCADLRNDMIKSYVQYFKDRVNSYQDRIKDIPVTSVKNVLMNPRSYYVIYKSNMPLKVLLRDFIDENNDYLPFKDVESRYLKIATSSADSLLEQFTIKNVQKLSSLVAKMPLKEIKIISAHARAYNIDSEMFFDFDNGAKFYVINKAVWGQNQAGTNFVRFPTTFHDVINSDGSRMKSPSEEKMNKEWK